MEQIEEFARLANQFCSWTESLKKDDLVDLHELIVLLSALFNNALLLPESESDENEAISQRFAYDEWKSIHKKYSPLPFQYYNEIFEPHDFDDKEPVTGDIHDDLADIYRDIKPGMLLFNKGFINAAAFEWKSSFSNHWGEHILSAIRAIYMFNDNFEDNHRVLGTARTMPPQTRSIILIGL